MTTIYIIMKRDLTNCDGGDTLAEVVDPCHENAEEVLQRYEDAAGDFEFYYSVKVPL